MALGPDAAGPRADHGAAFGGIHGVEHDEAGVVGEAIGIFEGVMKTRLERLTGFVGHQIDFARAGQNLAPADPVVNEQADPQQQSRAARFVDRQHETQRPDQMRRRAQQHFAFAQRLAHQAKFVMLEITQAAVNELGRRRRGTGGEIVLLDQDDAQAAAGGVARDAGAVDTAADDSEVEVGH